MTNYDLLEALNSIDDACVSAAKDATVKQPKKAKAFWRKWGGMAACFCLMLVVSVIAVYQFQTGADPNAPNIPPATSGGFYTQFDVEQGIFVGGKLYLPDAELSKHAAKENIGAVVGYVSFDNETTLDVCAFEYIPNDGKTNSVIVAANDTFYVYSFYSYILREGEGESRIMELLSKAAYVRSRETGGYEIPDATVHSKTDSDAIIELLSLLNEPRTQTELNRYYYDKFKNRFKEGEIWISEDGYIAYGGNQVGSNKFMSLVQGDARIISVVMEDNTYLTYQYLEGAGVIKQENLGYGYILTEEQIEMINGFLNPD